MVQCPGPLHHDTHESRPPGTLVRSTPWLAVQDDLSGEELQRFYQEPDPETPLELELATEEVYHKSIEEAAQWESRADEVQTRNSPGLQLQDVPDLQQQPHTKQGDRPH